MGRYLDLADVALAESDCVQQYEINENNEISPSGEPGGPTAASTKIVLLHCPPGVPGEWVQGVADLLAMARPVSCPGHRGPVVGR